jgi:LmbE family N-acetylglucosaminyl deacetylase
VNVLVIAPHPDDEAIGCGGALCNHAARGDHLTAVFLTSGELGLKHLSPENAWKIREAEARNAARILGITETKFLRLPDWTLAEHIKGGVRLLAPILKREQPGIVYLPHPKDGHPDHQAAWPLLQHAMLANPMSVHELRGYEVWTPHAEHDIVENITDVMPRKLRAVRAHRSQMAEFDYARAVKGLNQFRGELAGSCRFAEVFKLIA